MSQDNVPNKNVHLYFLVGAIIAFYLLKWSADWLWGYFTRSPDPFRVTVFAGLGALALGIGLYRSERVHGFATEVAGELKKVSWPTGKEVKAATLVVVIMTFISALIIFLFDAAWSSITQIIYG